MHTASKQNVKEHCVAHYKFVERDLLYISSYMRRFCQKYKGSAEADPGIYNGGSARLNKGLLAMIPKSVKLGSARVLLAMIPTN